MAGNGGSLRYGEQPICQRLLVVLVDCRESVRDSRHNFNVLPAG